MVERDLGSGLRVLLGVVGAAALGAGLVVAGIGLRDAYLGSPRVPTLVASLVALPAALGGALLIRGAFRGRIAVRSPRRGRRQADGR